MQPVVCVGCSKGPWRQPFPGPSCCHAVPSVGSRQVGACLWKAPGHSGQGPCWPNHNVCAPNSRTRSMWLKSSWGPVSSSLAIRRSTSPRSGDLPSLCVCSLVAQSCPSLCDSMDCSPPGFSVHGDCHALLQWVFPTQVSNPGLQHYRWIPHHLSHQGSPRILEWVAYPFSREKVVPF